VQHTLERHPAFFAHHLREVASIHVSHRNELHGVVFAEIVNAQDVGMRNAAGQQ
jgi:hypothetical protein